MRRKIITTVLLIALLCGTLLSTLLVLSACNNGKSKAIIMLPGMVASNMISIETGEEVWSTSGIIQNVGNNTIENISAFWQVSEDGVPVAGYRAATMADEDAKYTLGDFYKDYCDYLTDAYPDYDVLCWQYDFRQSNEISAQQFENFVNQKKYKEIVIIGHSNGGNVLTKYLTKKENRDKVKLFVPHGTPFFGSYSVFGYMAEKGTSAGFGNKLVDNVLEQLNLTNAARNAAILYQLAPSEALFSDEAFYLKHDGKNVTLRELVELIKARPYAKMSNGELKPALAAYFSHQEKDYVVVDGVKKHVTSLVPTEFICGTGTDTLVGFEFDADFYEAGNQKSKYGDGTVSLFSASAGNAQDAENVHLVDGISHIFLIQKKEVLSILQEIMAKYLGAPAVTEKE